MTSNSALYKFIRKYEGDLLIGSRGYRVVYHRDLMWISDGEEKKTPGEIFNALKEILEKEPYLVKEVKSFPQITPLQLMLLKSELSTLSIVNLMLSYGAEVNCSDAEGRTPLTVALHLSRGEGVIRAFLEKGADVTVVDDTGRSVLCYALEGSSSVDIVQLLLDAGCPTDVCKLHGGSALRCAIARLNFQTGTDKGTDEEVIRLLIKTKLDLNAIDKDARSPLCHVLQSGAELGVVDLLVAAGGSLYACMRHASPLHCVTSDEDLCWTGMPILRTDSISPSLRAEVVKKLLKLVKDDDPVQLSDPSLIQNAVLFKSTEKEAIKLLFDQLPDAGTVVDKFKNTLLHLAMLNDMNNLSVVEFLIESGVEVDPVNVNGETPLHLAAYRLPRMLSIVKMLLKAGSSVNAMNVRGDNPLQKIVNRFGSIFPENVDLLKMLFIAGSRIGNAAVKGCVGRVPFNKRQITKFNFCNMLVKCHFLENPDFHIEHVIQGHPDHVALSAFGADCERELQSMKSMTVGEGHTLRDFLDDRSSQRVVEYDFNQLEVIAGDAFPVYFDIIATKIVGGLPVEEILREVHVYTPKYISGKKEMVVLNYHVVCSIADRLTDDDLLRFILAFRKVDRGMCTAQARNKDAFEGKRGGGQSEQCPKRPKLQIKKCISNSDVNVQ